MNKAPRIEPRQEAAEPKANARNRVKETLNYSIQHPTIEQAFGLARNLSFMGGADRAGLNEKNREAMIKKFNESRADIELLLFLLNDAKGLPDGYFQKNPNYYSSSRTAVDFINEHMDNLIRITGLKFQPEFELDKKIWEQTKRILIDYCKYRKEHGELR